MTPDAFSKEMRSDIMRRIRGKNTRWEREFRRRLWRSGLRYRLYYGPHKIDVAFRGPKVAVFLDSCFWHYCPRHGKLPGTNRAYWRLKLEGNRMRDARTTRLLHREGWVVLRLWSHDFVKTPEKAAAQVLSALRRSRRAAPPRSVA